jgi:hypothetical protein
MLAESEKRIKCFTGFIVAKKKKNGFEQRGWFGLVGGVALLACYEDPKEEDWKEIKVVSLLFFCWKGVEANA